MLKTVLLLLPMMFNAQAATVQTQVSAPETGLYCIAIEVPSDPRLPEYVESVNEIDSEVTDKPTPIPYYNYRTDRKNSDLNNNMSSDKNSYNRKYRNGTYYDETREENTDDKKNIATRDEANKGIKNNTDNIVTIDDGSMNYSSYDDAYNALKGKFDSMFELQTSVDDLRRELMNKEIELGIHRDLYRERLKSLVEKWNKD